MCKLDSRIYLPSNYTLGQLSAHLFKNKTVIWGSEQKTGSMGESLQVGMVVITVLGASYAQYCCGCCDSTVYTACLFLEIQPIKIYTDKQVYSPTDRLRLFYIQEDKSLAKFPSTFSTA